MWVGVEDDGQQGRSLTRLGHLFVRRRIHRIHVESSIGPCVGERVDGSLEVEDE